MIDSWISSRKALESQHFTIEAVNSLKRFNDSISLNEVEIEKKKVDEFKTVVALSGRSLIGAMTRR